MRRIFIDSSTFVPAAYSERSPARALLTAAQNQQVTLIISPLVLSETERALRNKLPQALPYFEYAVSIIPFERVQPTAKDLAQAEGVTIDPFDVPIVAAAKIAKVDALVSYNIKHLFTKQVSDYIGAPVLTDAQMMRLIREEQSKK